MCYFDDNRQCEEWALLRGDCPVGGEKVTGYVTEAGRYCAITGGTKPRSPRPEGPEDEQGTRALPDGTVADAWAYYRGTGPGCSAGGLSGDLPELPRPPGPGGGDAGGAGAGGGLGATTTR